MLGFSGAGSTDKFLPISEAATVNAIIPKTTKEKKKT